MDYVFAFGAVRKIYRVDDRGVSVCKEKDGTVLPKLTVPWERVIAAGEGVMTSPAYQASRDVARAMTDVLPQGGHPERREEVQSVIGRITGFLMIAYADGFSGKKKMEALPMDVTAPARDPFLRDLADRLGDRWLGGGQDPSALRKRLGIPLIYQVRGTLVFITVMFAFVVFVYFSFFS